MLGRQPALLVDAARLEIEPPSTLGAEKWIPAPGSEEAWAIILMWVAQRNCYYQSKSACAVIALNLI